MSAEDHKQALPPGFRLGAYDMVRVLGVGGFGVTYLCEHAGLGVQVAVKEYLPNDIAVREGTEVYPKSTGDREGFEWGLSRFMDEARTLARFEHPNVVRVRDCFEANNTAYIVMDYEDGEPLDALLQRHGTLTEEQLKRVLLPVVEGLRQVHAAGFLHRDIKPANIFVRRSDESPVLLDFGSARQALGRRSRSMTAIASVGYSPPEQYESEGEQGAWTDIYALSALCYRAITGEPPMEATRRQSQMLRTQTDPLPKLAEVHREGYSPAFLEAVDWGLRLIETERPQSLDEWAQRLQQATTPRRPRDAESQQAGQHASPATTHRADKQNANGRRSKFLWLAVSLSLLVFVLVWLADELVGELRDLRNWDTRQSTIPYREPAATSHVAGDPIHTQERQVQSNRKAAEQGDAKAQCALGRRYYRGEGVPKSATQAAIWYRKAAEQGRETAQNILGHMYEIGNGVPKDAGQAAIWYRKAALWGLTDAQYNLASLYYKGEGVPLNLVQSYAWSSLAAGRGHEDALYLKTVVQERLDSQDDILQLRAITQDHLLVLEVPIRGRASGEDCTL